jgi:ribosomal protein S18 acetylase RimI-like enzyme
VRSGYGLSKRLQNVLKCHVTRGIRGKDKMIEIRSLSRNDSFDDLVSLSREFFCEYEAHHKDFFKIDHLKDEDIVGYFTSFCDQDTRAAFIAVAGEQVVGYITAYVKDQADYWQIKQVGDISGLMVQKDYRHQGIAKRLLLKAKGFFEAKGLKYCIVFTAAENRGALDFYQQNGFVPLYTTMIAEISSMTGET